MLNWTGKRPVSPELAQDALDLLQCFYERWAPAFQGGEPRDHTGIVDWLAKNFETIEQIVMGRPEDLLQVGLVAVAQTASTMGAEKSCSVLSRAGRFHKSLRFDSPHVALFPSEELALQAAGKAKNRNPASALVFVHLDFGIRPDASGDDDLFTADTRVRPCILRPDPARC